MSTRQFFVGLVVGVAVVAAIFALFALGAALTMPVQP